MPTTRWNKTKTPVNSDAYQLTGDLATMADSTTLTIPVQSQSERDGLAAIAPGGVLPIPTTVWRADLGCTEVWDGSAWKRSSMQAGGAPYAMAAGTASWVTSGSGNSIAVSFPNLRFSAPPIVTLGKAQSGLAKANFYVVNTTAASCTIGVQAGDGGTLGAVGVACYWTAVQMTPTTGDG